MTAEHPTPPTIEDVREAAAVLETRLGLPTPLIYSAALSERLDAHVSLKYEFANPVGVFKLRGGLFLASRLTSEHRAAGLVTASTGNHGQSIAYAAAAEGVAATIFVPEDANPGKVASMRRLGAEVVHRGARFDDSRVAAEEFAAEHGARYVHAANEPDLIAGVGTAALEVLDAQQPDTDLVIVPVGAGSGATGWTVVRDGLGASAEVWGVQSAQAPAAHDSWRAHQLLERPNTTRAEGLATGLAFELTLSVLWEHLDDFVLVDDEAIERAVVSLIDDAHVLAEPAGAAPLAAAVQEAERLRGKRVVLVVSGANITSRQLAELLGRVGT
ncbi:MAG: pyridoxal-phosphate dependent enzyme [Dehalococcoidia bacterium]